MWDKDDPKSKWLHLAVKLVAAIIIFKLGVMVGEFKVVKALVVGGGPYQKTLFWGGDGKSAGAKFFQQRVGPDERGNMMFWRGGQGDLPEEAPRP